MTPQPTFPLSRWERGSGGEAGDRSMTDWPSYVAAVLSGVLAATLAFYVWGRRVERRASETSQRLVLAAKEELMSVRENLHKSLHEKLAGVDQREPDLRTVQQPLGDPGRALPNTQHE